MAAQDAPGRGDGKGQMRRGAGFAPAAGFLAREFRTAAARRGLGDLRLLTAWEEIVGPESAAICRPVRVSHAAGGFGGTLILLAAPGRGPELAMLAETIAARVNAALGYRAVSRVKITQTAAAGFADSGTPFDRTGAPEAPPLPAEVIRRIDSEVASVEDPGLRAALAELGRAVAHRHIGRQTKGQGP
jgi:hypothetical protein